VLSAAGTTMGSIENAAIKLNGRIIENAMGTAPVLLTSLIQFYQGEALGQAYKLLTSADFLGNPAELIGNLGTGIQDFFYEPARGLVKSPQDFGRGVAKGSLSLLKNTFGGFLGAASKITGSVGKAAAFLSMDDKFIASQQRTAQQQPTNAASGVVSGLQSGVNGLFAGVTGIVLDPIKGAQREGVGGFLKGVGKGLVGVVAKPTAGLIDMTSQTMRGFSNSATDQEAKIVHRVRKQRYIDPSGAITVYNAKQAEEADQRASQKRKS